MGGGEGVGPGVSRPGVSCACGPLIAVLSVSLLAETWTYQQEMIGMVNLSDRVVPHVVLKSDAVYLWQTNISRPACVVSFVMGGCFRAGVTLTLPRLSSS